MFNYFSSWTWEFPLPSWLARKVENGEKSIKQTFIYEKRRFCQNTGINEKFEDIKEIIKGRNPWRTDKTMAKIKMTSTTLKTTDWETINVYLCSRYRFSTSIKYQSDIVIRATCFTKRIFVNNVSVTYIVVSCAVD